MLSSSHHGLHRVRDDCGDFFAIVLHFYFVFMQKVFESVVDIEALSVTNVVAWDYDEIPIFVRMPNIFQVLLSITSESAFTFSGER